MGVCRSSRPGRRGFVLIVTCIALTILLALAVLGIDIGRMLMIRSELQVFTDAAALNAALEFDGTEPSKTRARTAATSLATGPNAMKWDMGTQPITQITTSFNTDSTGLPSVRVNASVPAPVIFIRVFQPAESTLVAAASVARKSAEGARLVQ